MSFATIFDIVAKDTFSHLKQVEKWGFSTSVICRYRAPKFVLTDNGGEWAVEFDVMCRDYGINTQHPMAIV